jgi:hypothetical protein
MSIVSDKSFFVFPCRGFSASCLPFFLAGFPALSESDTVSVYNIYVDIQKVYFFLCLVHNFLQLSALRPATGRQFCNLLQQK